MCMFDYCDDTVTLIEDGHYVTARKDHRCAECGRQITKGEKYHTEYYVFDGRTTRHKTCAHCMVARDWLQNECGGFLYNGVEEDIREHCSYGQYPFALYRIAVGMDKKWVTKSGRLLPIPQMPPTTHERMKK